MPQEEKKGDLIDVGEEEGAEEEEISITTEPKQISIRAGRSNSCRPTGYRLELLVPCI